MFTIQKRNLLFALSVYVLCFYLTGCKKYLDKKSDQSFDVPESIESANALLNNFAVSARSYIFQANVSADDYYNNDAALTSMLEESRAWYLWQPIQGNITSTNWRFMYGKILNYNIAIETLENITPNAAQLALYNDTKGMAYLLRAFSYFLMANTYADVYDPATAAQKPGVPLRLQCGIDEPIFRATIQETYNQIVRDLTVAINHLPVSRTAPHRPTKAAAETLMAYIMLLMDDYAKAATYAEDAIKNAPPLIDFNQLNPGTGASFTMFNPEVLLHTVTSGGQNLITNNWKVDTLLFAGYHPNDLRRTIFFRPSSSGGHQFVGSLDGTISSTHFCGVSTAEAYLIRAEALARLNQTNEAMAVLNSLLTKRWRTGQFVPLTATDAAGALQTILSERRKELVGRGIRWYDLRRLSRESFGRIIIKRVYNGQTYELKVPGNQLMFQIPADVIVFSGMEQNPL